MDLPFELSTNYRKNKKDKWREYGMKFENDLAFHIIYKRYIYSSHCELCGIKFKTRSERQLEHDHTTNKFRNIVCRSCNRRKYDYKHVVGETGFQYIFKQKDKTYKQGFTYRFDAFINGKQTFIKLCKDLNKLVAYRDQWFKEHPEYYT